VSQALISVRALDKRFPGVHALKAMDFDLSPGELHCIVGENGAGKSTFIKLLSGALKPDSGSITVKGTRYSEITPHLARELGISTIYQENILAPNMTVAENVFLGREKTRGGIFVEHARSRREAQAVIDGLGLALRAEAEVERLSPTEQQFVKIVRALSSQPAVLILDEPTAMFDLTEAERLIAMVRDIRSKGIGIVYISHHLEEIVRIADAITVLRDGVVVARHESGQGVTPTQLALEMVGRPVASLSRSESSRKPGEVVLQVRELRRTPGSQPISFELRRGEILGIAGMVGTGRTEIVRALFGVDPRAGGSVRREDKGLEIRNPTEAIAAGMGFLTEDRQRTGLALSLSVAHNVSVAGLDRLGRVFLNLARERRLVQSLVDRLSVKTPSLAQEVRFLSGGNQQKVVLAKWLFKDVDILVIDEPTHGIDVNTKAEIHRWMREFAAGGKAIIMVSSEMPEVIALADRVMVMRGGAVAATLSGEEITEERLILSSVGRAGKEERA
jgi:ribose transport system ATP-binding protein